MMKIQYIGRMSRCTVPGITKEVVRGGTYEVSNELGGSLLRDPKSWRRAVRAVTPEAKDAPNGSDSAVAPRARRRRRVKED